MTQQRKDTAYLPLTGLEDNNPVGNTLANVPQVEQEESSSKAGDKPIMGTIMGKVVEALNQAQRRQRSDVSGKAHTAYMVEGLPLVPPKLVERLRLCENVRINSRILDGP